MQNGQITLFNLFDGTKQFFIPTYQRAFAWAEQQLDELASDFENQILDKAYFFGTILFREAPKDGPFEKIEIVDGQQRITSLMIYVRLILDRMRAAKQEVDLLENTFIRYYGRYKLHVQPEDSLFFENYILQGHDGSNHITTPSQKRLWVARGRLEERVNTYSSDQLTQIITKIERTRVLVYSVQDNAEATLIFEVTNDRGKPLTNLEKTKAFLMHKTYLGSSDPERDLESIQGNFIEIYRDLEPILEKQRQINEDHILQYHYTAFENWVSVKRTKPYEEHLELIKNHVNGLFHQLDHQRMMAYIERYTRELRESYRIMRLLLLEPELYGTQDLIAINRFATFSPLLIKTFKYDRSTDKCEFKRVARLAEIFSFRIHGVGRRRSDTGIDNLYNLARDFSGNFPQLIDKLKESILQYSSNEEFCNRLKDPKLYISTKSNDLRYLFWKYENYLRINEEPVAGQMTFQEFASTNSRTRLSIEHIAPQNPKESKVIVNPSIILMNKDFEEHWLDSLGNLTIDPFSANSSKQNEDIMTKTEKYFRRAPFKTQNELDTFLKPGVDKWDGAAIARRRDKILHFAINYWDCKEV